MFQALNAVPAPLPGIVPLPKVPGSSSHAPSFRQLSPGPVVVAGTSSATQQEDWDNLPPVLKPKLDYARFQQLSARLANTGVKVADPARKV